MSGTGFSTRSFASVVLVGLLLSTAGARRSRAADPAIDVEDLRRGLIATYRDGAQPTPAEHVRLEPTIALALKGGEAPHPRLDGKAGGVTWKGYLNVVRGGTYHFRARLRGEFKLTVGGKEVLAAKSADAEPALKDGGDVRLEAGVQPLVAEFTRPPGAARLELFWSGPQFRSEPLHHDFLGHLPAQLPERFKAEQQSEQGRFLAEEMNCVKCHHPADEQRVAKTLGWHMGPDLSQIGKRVHAGWIEAWLDAPQKLRPGAVMPRMFGDDDVSKAERYAVARYLESLGGPVQIKQPPAKPDTGSINNGRKLFASIGCVACHGTYPAEPDAKVPEKKEDSAVLYPAARIYSLSGLGSKTTPERLTEYLSNPLAHDPSGRMPSMVLQNKEAHDLASFLCAEKETGVAAQLGDAPATETLIAAFQRVDNRAEELAAFKKLPGAAQLKDLGKRIVIDKGCNNCHTIAPGNQPFAMMRASADLADLMKSDKQKSGCLAEKAERRGKAPVFSLSDADRAALRAFLNDGLKGAGSMAPAYAARVDFRRFNCLACHNRDGEGGLSAALTEQLRKFEKAENAEAVSPPTLTGVAHKLRTPWLKQVLTGAGRARPWMGLRMPQFGEANVGKLPEALAALEGTDTDETVHKVALDTKKIEAGRQLVGKSAFGCISCHDLAGIPNTGTRGPDMAGMNQRVRYDWYLRWLEQPQRIQAGTRMPSIFMDGKSLLPGILNGNADAQAEAIWGYLSLGNNLPLPEGLGPPKGLVLLVKDRPVLLRTFMPDAGSRAIAVGYPSGVSAAFDAHTCRLAYAWSGNFLDAAPVWDGRGGNPAKPLGARFWTAPPGCPVAASPSEEPPDFTSRAKDPAYGGALPEGKVFDGVPLLTFDGYGTDQEGVPTFRYHLQTGAKETLKVRERVEPLRATAGNGVGRRFVLDVPAEQTPWLLAGESTREPRLLDAKGAPAPLDLKSGVAEVPAEGRKILLPLDGDRVALLAPASLPEGSRWRVQKVGSVWQVLLRMKSSTRDGQVRVDVNVWVPYRDEPALLKDLLSAK